MKVRTVKWTEDIGHFLGRNGTMKCRGVEVSNLETVLIIEPLTSYGQIGRCQIAMPKKQAKNPWPFLTP